MLDDPHISLAESACRSVAEHVALGCMMINRVRPTVWLEGAVRTPRQGLVACRLKQIYECRAGEYLCSRIFPDIAQSKCVILHFSQHSRLIRRVYVTVVVVDQHVQPC